MVVKRKNQRSSAFVRVPSKKEYLEMEITGWLLDLFASPGGGVVLWLLGEDGLRQRLHQPFPVTFYAAGPAPRPRPPRPLPPPPPPPLRAGAPGRRATA